MMALGKRDESYDLGAAEAFKWTAQVLPARRVVHLWVPKTYVTRRYS